MRRLLYPLLAAAVLLLSTQPASAATRQEPCVGCYAIFFGNGIGYDTGAWDYDRDALAQVVGNTYNGKKIVYGNAVNPSADDMAIFRALQQKIAEYPGIVPWEMVARIMLGVLPPLNDPFIGGMRKALDDLIRNTFVPTNSDGTYVDDRVTKQVATLRDAIVTNQQRVVLVGHSQGTLYANSDYRLLHKDASVPKGRLKLASVASMASWTEGNGRYVTSRGDNIANIVRLLFPSTLPSNVSPPAVPSPDDKMGHFFQTTYLAADSPTRAAVEAMVRDSLADLAAAQ